MNGDRLSLAAQEVLGEMVSEYRASLVRRAIEHSPDGKISAHDFILAVSQGQETDFAQFAEGILRDEARAKDRRGRLYRALVLVGGSTGLMLILAAVLASTPQSSSTNALTLLASVLAGLASALLGAAVGIMTLISTRNRRRSEQLERALELRSELARGSRYRQSNDPRLIELLARGVGDEDARRTSIDLYDLDAVLVAWQVMEMNLRRVARKSAPAEADISRMPFGSLLVELDARGLLSDDLELKIRQLLPIRNDLAHGRADYSAKKVREVLRELDEVNRRLDQIAPHGVE